VVDVRHDGDVSEVNPGIGASHTGIVSVRVPVRENVGA